MKPLNDIRLNWRLKPQESCSSIKYLKKLNIDFDVYLPSKNMNLQRDFVWTLEQKRELIWSLLIDRHIPHLALMNCYSKVNENDDVYLVIDGKQRLSTMFDFVDDKFTIIIDNQEYLFSQLPDEYKSDLLCEMKVRYWVVNEQYKNTITDEDKITWFKFLNFAGTPQDVEHINNLNK